MKRKAKKAQRRKGTKAGAAKSPAPAALELRWIPAGQLAENPANWRRHPVGQMDALRAAIDDPEIGWAGVLLYNTRTKRLIDGHARRAAVDPETPVPVICGAWSVEGERKILATLDPLAGMATADSDALTALLAAVDFESPALKAVTDNLAEWLAAQTPAEGETPPADTSPKLERALKYAVVVECSGEKQQGRIIAEFETRKMKCRALVS